MKRWKNIKLSKGEEINVDVLKEIKRKDQSVVICEVNRNLH